MSRVTATLLGSLLACALSSIPMYARKLNPADFPLRVHLFSHNSHSHYHRRMLEYVDGEGRANLYQNGIPVAFDYGYRCEDRLINSMGYETYMARWKKPGRTIEVLLPVLGQPTAAESCELKVDMKEGLAYYKRKGAINEEPAEAFRQWMVAHDYDPERGKDFPVFPTSPASIAAPHDEYSRWRP